MAVVVEPVAVVVASNPHKLTVTKSDIGDAWPFTVDEGTLACRGASSVTFTAEGQSYALNGTAKSQLDLPGIEPIWKDAAYGLKKNVGPMIQRGLKLC